MFKHWQTMHEYQCFLHSFKVSLDSSERTRLHSEFWKPWQKLHPIAADEAMAFLLPFYPPIGRPAKNQFQILRSFILFFLLFSKGLIPSSLTLWVDKLKNDRLLAALIGCATHSLPPLGSYFDFMNLLWAAPSSGLYSRDKLLSATWDAENRRNPKADIKKHRSQNLRC